MFNGKNKELKIEFWTTVPGLSMVEEVVPKLYSGSVPSWWKNIKYKENNIKNCPSFSQMFSSSYLIPMWCDSKITRCGETFFWETSSNKFSWEYHTGDQFLDHVPSNIKNNFFSVAKAVCPWRIKTPKGYSVYQMPAFWNFSNNFSIATGIVDTDFHHEINQQVFLSLKNGETLFIKRGEPFALYFPFKRDFFSLEVREQSRNDFLNDQKSILIHATKFFGGYKNYQKFIKKDI